MPAKIKLCNCESLTKIGKQAEKIEYLPIYQTDWFL
jgi:hypothetical protein